MNTLISATKSVETSNLAENEIIDRILSGEKGLFEIIIRRYNPFLHKIGRSYGFTHEDTQDLMQDSFISAYMNLSKFEYRSSFKTWIIKIMLNNCFRKKQKTSYLLESPGDINDKSVPMYSNMKEYNVDRSVLNAELNAFIEQALSILPLDYRITFSLREINGLSVAETAETLDISESNVKVRVNRAKNLLRKELEKTYSPQDLFDFNLIYCDAMVGRVMNVLLPKENEMP